MDHPKKIGMIHFHTCYLQLATCYLLLVTIFNAR